MFLGTRPVAPTQPRGGGGGWGCGSSLALPLVGSTLGLNPSTGKHGTKPAVRVCGVALRAPGPMALLFSRSYVCVPLQIPCSRCCFPLRLQLLLLGHACGRLFLRLVPFQLFSFWAPFTLSFSAILREQMVLSSQVMLLALARRAANCPGSGAQFPVSSSGWLLWETVCGLRCARCNSHHA